jgi:hypothetical protein
LKYFFYIKKNGIYIYEWPPLYRPIVVVITGFIIAIVALTIESSCSNGDDDIEVECRRQRDRKILIRNILAGILLSPIAFFVVFYMFSGLLYVFRLIAYFLYRKPSEVTVIPALELQTVRGVSV